MLCGNVLEAIGKTPLIKLNKILASDGEARIFVKAEFMNPGGSTKDRAALNMLEVAMKKGEINADTVIIEPTSGNTGIGLAMAAAVLGLKVVLTMPESMSVERRKVLAFYGAELVLTPAKDGMTGAIEKANELHAKIGNSFIPSQFDNPANREAHFLTTAPEIFADLPDTAAVVAGAGTGGTIMGIADFVKANGKKTVICAVEPATSAVLSGEKAGAHGLQGIGAGFIPSILDKSLLDDVEKITDDEAIAYAKRLGREEGIAVGISAGAAVAGAVKLSEKIKGKIVVILPDTGMRYLSTVLYE